MTKTINNESLIQPSIDTLLTKVENKYVLALLASKRARELFDGEDALINEYYINNVTTAINEIDQEKVNYSRTDETEQAMIEKDTIL